LTSVLKYVKNDGDSTCQLHSRVCASECVSAAHAVLMSVNDLLIEDCRIKLLKFCRMQLAKMRK